MTHSIIWKCKVILQITSHFQKLGCFFFLIIFINTIVVSTIITLFGQVGKYVFLSHFRNANRPKEAECLITGNSFHDFRPWYRIVSQFNLSSNTRGYNQGSGEQYMGGVASAQTLDGFQGKAAFNQLHFLT